MASKFVNKDMEVMAVGRIIYFVLTEVFILTRTSVDLVEDEFFGKHICKQTWTLWKWGESSTSF